MARVACLVDELFEDAELREPLHALRAAGHEVKVVGCEAGQRIWGKQGEPVMTQLAARETAPSRFDALWIPGGYSPDFLRLDPDAVALARGFVISGKVVAAICHAGSLLAEADVVRDRMLTSWPSIRGRLEAKGAHWVNRAVVENGNLITSPRTDDLPAFCAALLRRLESAHWMSRPSYRHAAGRERSGGVSMSPCCTRIADRAMRTLVEIDARSPRRRMSVLL